MRLPPRSGEDADATTRRLRALSRARKLLRLAEDQGDTPEGRRARATAEALLTEHGLTRASLDLGAEDAEFRQRAWDVGGAEPWRLTLVHAVADAFDCVALHRKGTEGVELFGPKHAIPLVEYATVVYLRSLQAAWKKQTEALQADGTWATLRRPGQLTAREQFCVSFVLGVRERLERERSEEASADPALRAQVDRQRRDLASWMRQGGVRYRARPHGVAPTSGEGFRAGYETEINPALRQSGPGQRKLTG